MNTQIMQIRLFTYLTLDYKAFVWALIRYQL